MQQRWSYGGLLFIYLYQIPSQYSRIVLNQSEKCKDKGFKLLV